MSYDALLPTPSRGILEDLYHLNTEILQFFAPTPPSHHRTADHGAAVAWGQGFCPL